MLVVVRPSESDWSSDRLEHGPLHGLIEQLASVGVQHIEVAWVDHPLWLSLIRILQAHFPDLQLGIASVTSQKSLEEVIAVGVPYAMSPCFDPALLAHARRHGQLLVPGVFSPTEVRQAVDFGCELIKLFPASCLGIDYRRQLSAPMTPLPCMIAAGGLRAEHLDPWLAAGYHALALGRGVINGAMLDPTLLSWLR